MYSLHHYLKYLLETYPEIRKATTKPLWEKWLDNRQPPTHKQMEKIIGLLPVDDVNKNYFRVAMFRISTKFQKKGCTCMISPFIQWRVHVQDLPNMDGHICPKSIWIGKRNL